MWISVNNELAVNLEFAEQLRIDRNGKDKYVRVRTSTGGDFIIGSHKTVEDARTHLNELMAMLPQLGGPRIDVAKPDVPATDVAVAPSADEAVPEQADDKPERTRRK